MKLKIPKNTKNIKKIKIRSIEREITTTKGLFAEGCYGSECNDICCEFGCDVDLASLKLIYKHRDLIEPLIRAKVENCFSTELKADDDYIGGGFRETAVRPSDERCAFHLRKKKGCSLFTLVHEKGLPMKLVPTICKTYPITWHRGRLFVDRPLRRNCKCMEAAPKGLKIPSLYDTQKKFVHQVFDIEKKALNKLEKWAKK